jgi:hypothetical protein
VKTEKQHYIKFRTLWIWSIHNFQMHYLQIHTLTGSLCLAKSFITRFVKLSSSSHNKTAWKCTINHKIRNISHTITNIRVKLLYNMSEIITQKTVSWYRLFLNLELLWSQIFMTHQKSLLCGPYCKQFNKLCHTNSTFKIHFNKCLPNLQTSKCFSPNKTCSNFS